jgi:diguanylate cyclase (GGDEF)-like protein/PAS domain S-box-containing protein
MTLLKSSAGLARNRHHGGGVVGEQMCLHTARENRCRQAGQEPWAKSVAEPVRYAILRTVVKGMAMVGKSKQHDMLNAGAKTQFARLLRAAAEKKLAQMAPAAIPSRSVEEIFHELQICQVELGMQSEELHRAQLMLEESRDRYTDFYDSAPVGYVTLDSDALIDEINLTGAALLGKERGKLLHERFADFVAPEDIDHWTRYFTSVLQRDEKLSCELAVVRNDKTRCRVRLDSLRLLKYPESTVIRIVMTDISENMRSEEELREQEQFYRMITENIEDFIAVLDLEGRRLYNSPSYSRLFGDPEALKGTDSFAEIHPDDRERVRRVFGETVKTGSGLRTEYRFAMPDGSIRYMESRGGVIKNIFGRPSRVVVVSRDITERIMAEDKIRNMAFYDALTKLPNRRMFDDRLNQAMAASNRSGRYGALMFLDMDNFKPLNDQYGHSAGDLLLREVSRRIISCVREMDTVSRFGGDEFVVMLTELDTDKKSSIAQTGIVAEKIRAILAQPYKLVLQQEGDEEMKIEYRCSSSIGVVMFIDHEYKPADLVKRADMVMYQAKESGRNRVRFFNT